MKIMTQEAARKKIERFVEGIGEEETVVLQIFQAIQGAPFPWQGPCKLIGIKNPGDGKKPRGK